MDYLNTNLEKISKIKQREGKKKEKGISSFVKFYESFIYNLQARRIFLVYKGKIYEDAIVITETVRLDTRCRIA